jgi:hypothetical protein
MIQTDTTTDSQRVRAKPGEAVAFVRDVAIPFSGDECLHWPYGLNSEGRAQVTIKGKNHRVYRLVCEAVHGDAPTRTHECAHSCGKGHLGCVNPRHLRWATSAENKADMLIHGTGTGALTEDDVRAIRGMLSAGHTQVSIAAEYNISQPAVSHIATGRNWARLA